MRRNEIVLRKKHEKLNNWVAKTQAKYVVFATYEVLPRILFLTPIYIINIVVYFEWYG